MGPALSRRGFLNLSACSLATAGLAPLLLSPGAARAQFPPTVPAMADPDAVLLNFNENPLGAFPSALRAAGQMLAQSHRYLFPLQRELTGLFAERNNLPTDHVTWCSGSSVALDVAAMAFTSADKPLVLADPTFEQIAGMAAAHGARVTRVPLRADGAHDVHAMAAAEAAPGVIYLCNPNNPTGGVTTRADIEWLLANKPAGSVVVVDEAYIHYCDDDGVLDLVRAGADLLVLRTFSKIYGMAGMRLGLTIARPDLLKAMSAFGTNSLPVASAAAGIACLRDDAELAARKLENTRVREQTVAWLRARGHDCLPSQANCFMVDVKSDAQAFARGMATHKVFVGRAWSAYPTHVRISVGTDAEMARFRDAFAEVTAG